MIERFNFYDIYGYLIPGAVVLSMFAVPFEVARKVSLPEWPILALGVIAAYVLGHFLQALASTAIPSSRGSERVFWRAHSATVLNKSDITFSSDLKIRIQAMVQEWFGLNVQVEHETDPKIGGVRQDAFFLSRRIANETSSYPEQFQGLYTMMRGLAVACWLGAAYNIGWSISAIQWRQFAFAVFLSLTVLFFGIVSVALYDLIKPVDAAPWVATAYLLCLPFAVHYLSVQATSGLAAFLLGKALVLSLLLSIYSVYGLSSKEREKVNQISLCLLVISSISSGFLLSTGKPLSINLAYALAALACFYLIASFRFLNAYWFFAREFAKAVWVHFSAGPAARPSDK